MELLDVLRFFSGSVQWVRPVGPISWIETSRRICSHRLVLFHWIMDSQPYLLRFTLEKSRLILFFQLENLASPTLSLAHSDLLVPTLCVMGKYGHHRSTCNTLQMIEVQCAFIHLFILLYRAIYVFLIDLWFKCNFMPMTWVWRYCIS